MATFFIEQFGCRATQADAAALERQLLERGYAVSPNANSADVVVVNTCTVTAAADLQARQSIHAIQQKNPAVRIVVTGCYAQRAPDELAALRGVSWVVGNSHKPEIPRLIEEMDRDSYLNYVRDVIPSQVKIQAPEFVPLSAIEGGPFLFDRASSVQISSDPLPTDAVSGERHLASILTGDIRELRELLVAPVDGGEAGHTRPVLKIQDGCDKRCSYCVIPHVRGRSRSLLLDRAIAELSKLSLNGAGEVVLSGIDIGNYGHDLDPRTNLDALLRRMLDETPIERLRVSSIEPIDVNEDLISLFASSDRIAQHLHMPLQSGSDRVLSAMHRWYRAEHYARRVELVREWLPDAAIGADVIAGFPGETEEDHRATLALIDRLPLTYLHVFSFSPRPGTTAVEMQGQVSGEVIHQRARELRTLGEKKKSKFYLSQIGRAMRALTLNRGGDDVFGPWTRVLCGNYLDIRIAGRWPSNKFVEIKIAGIRDSQLVGTAI